MKDLEQLAGIVADLADQLDALPDARDGTNGVDGRDGMPGLPGRDGRDGRDGLEGPRGADGRDGMDGSNGRDGARGPEGEPGPPGEIGMTPRHEWRGTLIRFELDGGGWGPWVDVQGPRGTNGITSIGSISTKSLKLDGGGAFDEDTGLDGRFAGTNFAGVIGVGGGGAATVFAERTFNAGRSS